MGVPTSEVGYTSATAGRGDHEVHKGHVMAFGKKEKVSHKTIQFIHATTIDNRIQYYFVLLQCRYSDFQEKSALKTDSSNKQKKATNT
jgi:hypothetical protein